MVPKVAPFPAHHDARRGSRARIRSGRLRGDRFAGDTDRPGWGQCVLDWVLVGHIPLRCHLLLRGWRVLRAAENDLDAVPLRPPPVLSLL